MTKEKKHGLGTIIGSFIKVGFIGFGGGSALIPIIEKEVVDEKKLISADTYREHTITANVTPGALPVKLAAASGECLKGPVGMLTGAYSVALPGTFFTIVLLACLSILSPEFLHYVEFASIGVSVFIIALLVEYISKVMVSSKALDFGKQAVAIMLITAVCTFGNEIRGFIKVFIGDLPTWAQTSLLDVSTIDFLIVTFWFIAGTQGNFKNPRGIISTIIGIVFLLAAGDMSPVPKGIMTIFKAAIVVAIVVLVMMDGKKEKAAGSGTVNKLDFRRPTKQALLFAGVIAIATGIVAAVVGNPFWYLSNGFVSSVTSFGGGEAYLTVADGMFVGSGYVPSGEFYGQILPIANALPGPILVKLLAGIGYIKGISLAGMGGGFAMAFMGFTIGIGASVIVFAYVNEIYKSFSEMKVFKMLNLWILPVVCGLLISTIIAMLNESFKILHEIKMENGLSLGIFAVCFLVVYLLQHKLHLHDVICLLILAALSLGGIVLLI